MHLISTTANAANAHTARQPRLAIRKSDLYKRPMNIKAWLLGIISTLGFSGLATTVVVIGLYIVHLKHEREKLKGQVSYLQQIGRDNQQLADWINKAVQKTTITSYVPQLGGINGGSHYANGQPVLPVAASRQALKNGSVAMGDYVLLIGQIKDKKGESIKDHSFDVQAPDLDTATLIGKRPFKFVNLTSKESPYRPKP